MELLLLRNDSPASPRSPRGPEWGHRVRVRTARRNKAVLSLWRCLGRVARELAANFPVS